MVLSVLRPERAQAVGAWARGEIGSRLGDRDWAPKVIAYNGYGRAGDDGWVRVLARVVLVAPGYRFEDSTDVRGWRRFVALPARGTQVTIKVGLARHRVFTDAEGYIDQRLAVALPAGWREAQLWVGEASALVAPSRARLRVIDPQTPVGVVSDIDDTVIITMLPRPLVAFRNTFMLREGERRAVPGMANLYEAIVRQHPETPFFYLSTGAWNVAGNLRRFLKREGFPSGPLLLTDWGPTQHAWFRSGREHKRTELRRLFSEFPELSWVLIGDDGQHDPAIYAEAAENNAHVSALLIRQLSAAEQLTTHGTPIPRSNLRRRRNAAVELRAPNGEGLLELLRDAEVLDSLGRPT